MKILVMNATAFSFKKVNRFLLIIASILCIASLGVYANDEKQIVVGVTGMKFESAERNKAFRYLLCSQAFSDEDKKSSSEAFHEAAIAIYEKLEDGQSQYYLDYGRTEYLFPLNKLERKLEIQKYENKHGALNPTIKGQTMSEFLQC